MQLMGLINSVCVMLRSSPFHKENYARLILGVIIQFYQRCFDRFQNLVASKASTRRGMPTPVLASQWAQQADIAPCLADLLGSVVSFFAVTYAELTDGVNRRTRILRKLCSYVGKKRGWRSAHWVKMSFGATSLSTRPKTWPNCVCCNEVLYVHL
jgi:hypothetical protein